MLKRKEWIAKLSKGEETPIIDELDGLAHELESRHDGYRSDYNRYATLEGGDDRYTNPSYRDQQPDEAGLSFEERIDPERPKQYELGVAQMTASQLAYVIRERVEYALRKRIERGAMFFPDEPKAIRTRERMAEFLGINPIYFRQLCDRGVFEGVVLCPEEAPRTTTAFPRELKARYTAYALGQMTQQEDGSWTIRTRAGAEMQVDAFTSLEGYAPAGAGNGAQAQAGLGTGNQAQAVQGNSYAGNGYAGNGAQAGLGNGYSPERASTSTEGQWGELDEQTSDASESFSGKGRPRRLKASDSDYIDTQFPTASKGASNQGLGNGAQQAIGDGLGCRTFRGSQAQAGLGNGYAGSQAGASNQAQAEAMQVISEGFRAFAQMLAGAQAREQGLAGQGLGAGNQAVQGNSYAGSQAGQGLGNESYTGLGAGNGGQVSRQGYEGDASQGTTYHTA